VPNMMYRSGKDSPHSHGTPVDVVPTTAVIGPTANTAMCHCLVGSGRVPIFGTGRVRVRVAKIHCAAV